MNRRLCLYGVAGLVGLAALLIAQTATDFDGRGALLLRNSKLELTVLTQGATLANLTLQDDADKLSPYWNTDRAQGPGTPKPPRPAGSIGHFLCLDGFGTPSDEEKAAGWPTHGEASRLAFETVPGAPNTITLRTRLPLAQENVTRTMTLLEGENVVYVNTEVESLTAFDRPFSWAEHATTGPPFLMPGQTVIDISATNCRVRAQKAGSTGKLAYGKDFKWPLAPLTKGGNVDITAVPANETSLDLAACQVDAARTTGYITAVRPDKGLIFGYIFRREDYPWVMSWMNYTGNSRAARGFEFSTQPFDISHRETVDAHDMFGTPVYKWLPAKAKLHSSFLFFYAHTPENFGGVSDVKLENGMIAIHDRAGHSMSLPAKRPL